ncbi:hypothetical protein [Mycobacterium helveticum]|uniref:Uncharacterized protein n=1 Tax=Mycobacterium helveticum TaxID=2592811 RepID=A0A557XZU3_9MYCO|nr:hypothetical protein [Mycobacterium helveticum]TVS87770.1 hypothetical protein FPZ46_07395 [Mycobacterium helveticum]TVS91791.1 hypothetical protein FPZ47_03365 [Mycobacterium helveticum]
MDGPSRSRDFLLGLAGVGWGGDLDRLVPMLAARSDMTIDEVLPQFLAEQRKRLAERTYRRYEEVVELLRDCLDGYAYQSLDDIERHRWEEEFASHEDGAFCRLFGPEKIAENLGEFLDYFMVRKVIAGQDLLKAAGTVTGKLVRWLGERGYIDGSSADQAGEQAREAARDLPMADRLGALLHDVTRQAPAIDPDHVDAGDWVEDYLQIVEVGPGKIWFENGVGPIAVPRKASDLARPGWSVFVTAARIAKRWHLLEVGVVYP